MLTAVVMKEKETDNKLCRLLRVLITSHFNRFTDATNDGVFLLYIEWRCSILSLKINSKVTFRGDDIFEPTASHIR